MSIAARQGRVSCGGVTVRVCTAGSACVCTAGWMRSPLPCAVPKASANSQKQTTPAHSSARFLRSIPHTSPRKLSFAVYAAVRAGMPLGTLFSFGA